MHETNFKLPRKRNMTLKDKSFQLYARNELPFMNHSFIQILGPKCLRNCFNFSSDLLEKQFYLQYLRCRFLHEYN